MTQVFDFDTVSAIEQVPGLFISSVAAPRSPEILDKHGITHVLSLTGARDRPQITEGQGIQQLHLDIDDNPYEDLLMSLDGICAWIEDALGSGTGTDRTGVLVHCLQGISRSGAVIIAYLMHTRRSLTYDAALELARESRPVIAPNSGFADQLRLWPEMGYSIYEKASEGGEGDGTTRKMKRQYEEWVANRGVLLTRDQTIKREVVRKSMADLVAQVEKRRIELKQKNEQESSSR